MSQKISKARKFIQKGLFLAELNEFLKRECENDGYIGVETRVTPQRTEIIVKTTKPKALLGEKGRKIRELTSVIQKRFHLEDQPVEIFADSIANRGLSAVAQADSIKQKLLQGLAVRRACYSVLRFVMDSGAKGCEILVSGKLRQQRAKAMKFKDGYMIKTGEAKKEYVDVCIKHVYMRQGVLGVKCSIMLPFDPTGKNGSKNPLPDFCSVNEPKDQ